MKAQFSQMHWGRVLLTGVLVVILVVILNTVLLVLATHVWSQPDQAQIAMQVSAWSTYILLLGSPVLRALVTFVLNMAAGFLGGVLGSRGRRSQRQGVSFPSTND